jgi:hypothetical protein
MQAPACASQGIVPIRKIQMTRVAQPYPAGLSRLLAIALCVGAKWCKAEKLNVAKCAKAGEGRIGEASNPGPANRRFGQDRITLESMPIQTARTLAMERRFLEEFLRWCNSELKSLGAKFSLTKCHLHCLKCCVRMVTCCFKKVAV